MTFIISVLCLFIILFYGGCAKDIIHPKSLLPPQDSDPLFKFPEKSDSSTPIVSGDDPKASKLPPKVFPTGFSAPNYTEPPILNGTVMNIKEMKHSIWLNLTQPNPLNSTKEGHLKNNEKSTEQEDMLHSKYKGGHDVDELLTKSEKTNTEKDGKKVTETYEKKVVEKNDKKIEGKDEKKASEKDEKKIVLAKKDPKSEILVSPDFDKSGPKLMNETKVKSGESMLESTSRVMAMSSSMLSNTKPKQHGLLEPAKSVATVLFSVIVLVSLGAIGLLVWKRIAMRRSGRDVLINEDDFDEVSDMHTFESAQIQIT